MIGNRTWYTIGKCGDCINFKPKKGRTAIGYGRCRKFNKHGTFKGNTKGCGDFDDKKNY